MPPTVPPSTRGSSVLALALVLALGARATGVASVLMANAACGKYSTLTVTLPAGMPLVRVTVFAVASHVWGTGVPVASCALAPVTFSVVT